MPVLVFPAKRYKASFLAAMREFYANSEPFYFHNVEINEETFDAYLQLRRRWRRGKTLENRRVAYVDYWLVEGNSFIGYITVSQTIWAKQPPELPGTVGYAVRPTCQGQGYGKLMLKLMLPKLKDLGMDKVLISCDSTKLASKGIILANGGVFQHKVTFTEPPCTKLHFHVSTA